MAVFFYDGDARALGFVDLGLETLVVSFQAAFEDRVDHIFLCARKCGPVVLVGKDVFLGWREKKFIGE